MAVEIVTKEDLQVLRLQLLSDIRQILAGLPKPINTKNWLKAGEVKRVLKLSDNSLATLRNNGTLKYTRLGGIYYYDYEYIQQLMDRKT